MIIDNTNKRYFSTCPIWALFILFVIIIPATKLSAQSKCNIYYLVIGSGNYATDSLEQGANGFNNLNSPGYSAHLMDSVLGGYRFNKGIRLISTDTTAITKGQIDSALIDLIASAKKDQTRKKKKCVFVVYYAGHGIKHPNSFDLFLVPGYFPNNMKYIMIGGMREVSHSVLSVYYKLKWAAAEKEPWEDFRIIMLMDCCYNSDHDDHIPLKYSQSSSDAFYNIGWVPPIEIQLEKSSQKPKPKIVYDEELSRFYKEDGAYFAASNGKYAQTVASPIAGDKKMIAPICRRTLLFLNNAGHFDVDEYLNSLSDLQLDTLSQPITYFHKPETKFDLKLPSK